MLGRAENRNPDRYVGALAHHPLAVKPAHATLNVAAGKGKLRPLGPLVSSAGSAGRQPLEYAPPNPVVSTSRLAAGSAYRFRQTPHHHSLYAQFVHFHERGQPAGPKAPGIAVPSAEKVPR